MLNGRQRAIAGFVNLLHQHDRAGNHRSGEAGPADGCEGVAALRGEQAVSRSGHVGGVDPSKGGPQPLGVGDEMIRGVGRRHADRVGDDRGETLTLRAVEAVTRGGDDRDVESVELAHEVRDLLADAAVVGIPVRGVVAAVGEGEIDRGDVIGVVVVDDPLKGVGDLVEVALVVVVEDPEGHDVGPGSDPEVVGVVGGDQPGNGGAMIERRGERIVGVGREVVAGDDLAPDAEAAAERLVVVVHPRVDDGHGEARAVHLVLGPGGGGACDRVEVRPRGGRVAGGEPRRLAGQSEGDGDIRKGAGSLADAQERPGFQGFHVRAVVIAVSGAARHAGPPHGFNLPGRPPDHWRRPSRESVGTPPFHGARLRSDDDRPERRGDLGHLLARAGVGQSEDQCCGERPTSQRANQPRGPCRAPVERVLTRRIRRAERPFPSRNAAGRASGPSG